MIILSATFPETSYPHLFNGEGTLQSRRMLGPCPFSRDRPLNFALGLLPPRSKSFSAVDTPKVAARGLGVTTADPEANCTGLSFFKGQILGSNDLADD
jgi:hypothetical protein